MRPGVHIMYMYIGLEFIMAAAVERIVVQATAEEKRAIVAKAKRLGLPIAELMRRGATAYRSADADEELGGLADAAKAAAERASASIDRALEFIEASNKRIAALEAGAKRSTRKAG
jgi:hypothetical protein